MHTVWAPRREEVLRDCLVSPAVFQQIVNRLDEFVVPYQHVLETEASQRNVYRYLQGLLSHLPGKNAEDIATFVAVERQVIQDFIGTVPWDHRPLVAVLVGQVARQLGAPDGIIAFDPSSFPKRVTHSVGVKRQWCGHRGKVDNCQVGVFMGYVCEQDYALLDFRLSLPEDWARDEQRRQECHVPLEVRYQTRQDQCLEMLDTWGDQVPHGWVTGDDELGRHMRFRHALCERGERYVLGVPCNTTIRDLEAPVPTYAGRGRPPKAPWQAVTQWRQSLDAEAWTHLTVRDGEKGPVEIEMVRRRVQTRLERKGTGPEEWLIVTRQPRSDDRTLEPRASRDATDQDARYRYHYYLSPTCVSKGELAEPSLSALARVIKAGACWRCFACSAWTLSAVKCSVNYSAMSWRDSTIIGPVSVYHCVSYTYRYSRFSIYLDCLSRRIM
jgi:SRSO17 transposase